MTAPAKPRQGTGGNRYLAGGPHEKARIPSSITIQTLELLGQRDHALEDRRRFEWLAGAQPPYAADYRSDIQSLDRSDFDEAIRLFRILLRGNSSLSKLRPDLAFALFVKGDYRTAAQEHGALGQAHPNDADLRMNLAAALIETRDLEKARAELDQSFG